MLPQAILPSLARYRLEEHLSWVCCSEVVGDVWSVTLVSVVRIYCALQILVELRQDC